MRTTLQTRTAEQGEALNEHRENRECLKGVTFPRELRVEHVKAGIARADFVFLAVPSARLDSAIVELEPSGLKKDATEVSRCWPSST